MPRLVSFIVLVAIILLLGALSFKVMAHFYVPLFLAAVLVVVFRPLHRWILYHCSLRRRLAAVLTTVSIVLIVLLPLTSLLVQAIAEGSVMFADYSASLSLVADEGVSEGVGGLNTPIWRQELSDPTDGNEDRELGGSLDSEIKTPGRNESSKDKIEKSSEEEPSEENQSQPEELKASTVHRFLDQCIASIDLLLDKVRLPHLPAESVHTFVHEKLTQAAATLAFGGMRLLFSTMFGLAIMILALYYFFADGPDMIVSLMRLSPLDDGYEQELLDKFGDISRSVVLATLLSAVVQGVLASVGYYFIGIDRVFFLTALTMFLAMVPFVGAAAVWVPVCIWYFYQEQPLPAALLAAYCMVVVSMVDNVIKPMVLHGRSNLHPLLALLSVVGGVQALGPIGILVGPLMVSLLQALLVMLNKELLLFGDENRQAVPALIGEGAALAETVVAPGAPAVSKNFSVEKGTLSQGKSNQEKPSKKTTKRNK